MGAGIGLESEMPALMSALSGTLEDAIKSGLDTSDMRKDLSGTLLSLVKATPGGSVEGAMTIARSGASTKKSGAAGQVSDIKGLLGWKLGQQKALESINTKEGQEALIKEGLLNTSQKTALEKIGYGNITEKDLYKNKINVSFLTKRSIEKMADTDYATGVYREGLKQFKGLDIGTIANTLGYTGSESAALYGAVTNPITYNTQIDKKGRAKIKGKSGKVTSSVAGLGIAKKGMYEDLTLNEGAPFAEKTMELNKIFTTMAKTAAPGVVSAMNKVWAEAEKAAKGLASLSDVLTPAGDKKPYKSKYDQRSDATRLKEDLKKIFD
jgi:hypothetical protein